MARERRERHDPPHPNWTEKCPVPKTKQFKPLVKRAHQLGAHVEQSSSGHLHIYPPQEPTKPIVVSSTPRNADLQAKGLRRSLAKYGLAD